MHRKPTNPRRALLAGLLLGVLLLAAAPTTPGAVAPHECGGSDCAVPPSNA